jgi:O-methyltransferase involved in polyketide biosynthesis
MTVAVCAGKGRILSQPYSLLPADLRDLDVLRGELAAAGFDAAVPTLVLAECVLVYMEVLHWQCRLPPNRDLP